MNIKYLRKYIKNLADNIYIHHIIFIETFAFLEKNVICCLNCCEIARREKFRKKQRA